MTFVFQDSDEGMKCAHIHCSNPYQEMMGGEHFPDKIGRQSYDYVQERVTTLEEAYASPNQANQAKSDFLSRMSHDIRTPMNAIMGMTAIAENYLGNDEKIRDCLAKIRLSGVHLLDLINEVLDMSKIESGNMILSEDIFHLSSLLEEVYQIVKPNIDRKRQHYSVSVEKLEHDAVYGDTVRMKQILINLLSNAVKYTQEDGHIAVRLEKKLSSENGVGCFELIVEDDGIGMSEGFLKKLFLPFEREEDSRVSQIQGTGLGLSITLNLVQLMNGTIQVQSQLNHGSRFLVTIYLKLVQTEDESYEKKEDGSLNQTAQFKPGVRILLAEDNLLNQEIVKELLSLYGLEIVCASNGKEAMDLFLKEPPGAYAMILMDIQMPVMDGYSAARAIRKLGKTGQRPDAAVLPIAALTANAFADDVYQAKQAGMNEHVMKPVEIDKLIDTTHRWLDRKD